MGSEWIDTTALILSRRAAIEQAVDSFPELRGAGLILVGPDRPRLLRHSKHASDLDTYLVVEVRSQIDRLPGALMKWVRLAHDSLVTLPGVERSSEVAAEMLATQVEALVESDEFMRVAPKVSQLAGAALSLALAVPGLGQVAAVGMLGRLVLSVGAATSGIGVGVAAGELQLAFTNPKLARLLDESEAWKAYKGNLEAVDVGLAVAGPAVAVAKNEQLHVQLAGRLQRELIARVRAVRAEVGAVRGMTPEELARRIGRMPYPEFRKLADAIATSNGSKGAGGANTLRRMQKEKVGPAGRKLAPEIQGYMTREITRTFATEVRRRLLRAIYSDVRAVNAFAGRTVREVGADRGAMWTGASLLLNDQRPGAQVLEAISGSLGSVVFHVVQQPVE